MMQTEVKKPDGKVIALQRWTNEGGKGQTPEARREQFLSEQIVVILKDLLGSLRLPRPSHNH